jgi:uncharacterized protein
MSVSLERRSEGVVVPVKVRAGARKTGVAGEHGGALRVDVAAAPEKGKANRAVIDVLAGVFGVAKSAVELMAGATSAQKRFLVRGMDLATAKARIDDAVGDS